MEHKGLSSSSAKSQAMHALWIPSLLQKEGSKYSQSTSHLFCYQLHLVHAKPPTSTLSTQQFGEKGSPLLNLPVMKRNAWTNKDDTSPDAHMLMSTS